MDFFNVQDLHRFIDFSVAIMASKLIEYLFIKLVKKIDQKIDTRLD